MLALFLAVIMYLRCAIYTSFPIFLWLNTWLSEMVGKGWSEIAAYQIEILWVKKTSQY